MPKKAWNLMYVVGHPAKLTRATADAENPLSRAVTLAAAERLAANGWRVGIEHRARPERIFESKAEMEHKASDEVTRIVDFAKANEPGYAGGR